MAQTDWGFNAQPTSIELFMEQYELTPPTPGGFAGDLPRLGIEALHDLIEELRDKGVIQ